MKIKIDEIRILCKKVLTVHGIAKKNASIIVDDYIEGELLGKKTHGLFAFKHGMEKIIQEKGRKIKIEKDKQAFALINGNRQAGQLVAEVARKLVIKKAKKFGIAMVGSYNAQALLRPGSQAESITRHDLVGLVFHNGGGSLVAPYGGIDPVISTNPIGYAIPTTADPIVADMAVSERAWGEIRLAKAEGRTLSPDCFLDERGNITIDPNNVFSALPFGGYKGYIMGLLVELLTGTLVRSGFGSKKLWLKKDAPGVVGVGLRGALFIAIDPSKFVDIKIFKRQNSELVKQLKRSRKRKGVREILIPGERAYRHKKICLKRGWIEVDEKVIDEIKGLLK
ncbi:MAG TPA: hypothetical protein DCS29_00615 [Candidatus Magasanikbacteria bacterium]|nr:MAG: hypothetical protein A2479_00870 [Candidatus Magasanikbacteria bacterium RIFOXYC2_FULL_39_8]HAT03268.1 hypothetical protein [Candidatus Magasanikbacteria bacterium]